jgi:hypothetical protein
VALHGQRVENICEEVLDQSSAETAIDRTIWYWPLPGPATPLGFMHALGRPWEAV